MPSWRSRTLFWISEAQISWFVGYWIMKNRRQDATLWFRIIFTWSMNDPSLSPHPSDRARNAQLNAQRNVWGIRFSVWQALCFCQTGWIEAIGPPTKSAKRRFFDVSCPWKNWPEIATNGARRSFLLLIWHLPTFWAERILILRKFTFWIFLGSHISGFPDSQIPGLRARLFASRFVGLFAFALSALCMTCANPCFTILEGVGAIVVPPPHPHPGGPRWPFPLTLRHSIQTHQNDLTILVPPFPA